MPHNLKACVVGAGPNGLAAAIVLARAGLQVEVFEAEAIPGGSVRTMELTLPGFLHDFGSAVHPLGDGTSVMLERSLEDAQRGFGIDGQAWRGIMQPFVEHWNEFAPEVLRP